MAIINKTIEKLNIYTNFKNPFWTKNYIIMSIWLILMISILFAFKKGFITSEMISNSIILKFCTIFLCFLPFVIKIKCFFSTEEHSKKFAHSLKFEFDGILLDDKKTNWVEIDSISFLIKDYKDEMFKWILWNFENLRSSGCDNLILIKLKNGIKINGHVQIDSKETISELTTLLSIIMNKNKLDSKNFIFMSKNYCQQSITAITADSTTSESTRNC